jgi:argininosuccinate lyase
LTLSALGVAPRLVGCVGEDDLGELLLNRLRSAAVPVEDVRVLPSTATGVSIAFEAPSRDRSFLMSPGGLAAFERTMVPEAALEASLVLLGGYFALPRIRGHETEAMLRDVRAAGGTSLLDTGSAPDGWTAETRTEVLELLPLVDVLVPNEIEALHLSGEADVDAAARALQRRTRGWVVIKRGGDGCIAAGPDGAFVSEPAPSVDVVDTTGAGDAFNAGLLLRLAEADPVPEALPFAVRVASAVVSRPSSDRYPRRVEISG